MSGSRSASLAEAVVQATRLYRRAIRSAPLIVERYALSQGVADVKGMLVRFLEDLSEWGGCIETRQGDASPSSLYFCSNSPRPIPYRFPAKNPLPTSVPMSSPPTNNNNSRISFFSISSLSLTTTSYFLLLLLLTALTTHTSLRLSPISFPFPPGHLHHHPQYKFSLDERIVYL